MILFVGEILTGLVRLQDAEFLWVEAHYLGGRLIVPATLAVCGISLAAIIQYALAVRKIVPWFRVLIPLAAFAVVVNTSFTGYLGPSNGPGLDPDTLLRFRVIHLVAEPTLAAALLVWWWLLLRRLEVRAASIGEPALVD